MSAAIIIGMTVTALTIFVAGFAIGIGYAVRAIEDRYADHADTDHEHIQGSPL